MSHHNDRSRGIIIIGGAQGSGTTLLAAALNRHPRILCAPELGVLDQAVFYERDWQWCQRLLGRNMHRWLEVKDIGYTRRVFRKLEHTNISHAELRQMLLTASDFRDWIETFARRHLNINGKQRWAEKTTDNIFCATQALDTFPNARFIQIIRDGRDSLLSQLKRGLSLYTSSWRWLCSVAAGYQLLEHPRAITIRYEELVRRPRKTLSAICSFLGESFEESMLVPRDDATWVMHGSWTSSPAQAINTESVENYRTIMDREMEELFFSFSLTENALIKYRCPFRTVPEALEFLGYEPSRDSWPEKKISYILRKKRHSVYKRLRFWLSNRVQQDHVPQDMCRWRDKSAEQSTHA